MNKSLCAGQPVGLIPIVERSKAGHRRYTQQHLQALHITKSLQVGFGFRKTQVIMHSIHNHNLPQALAIIDARHAEIHKSRCEIEEALHILRTTSSHTLIYVSPFMKRKSTTTFHDKSFLTDNLIEW